jgi:16S rRNA (cytosine967-C5)-methyltransferase
MSASPARLSALWELDQRALPNWPARTMRRLRRFRLSDARDIDLAEKITHGVVKELLVLQRLATEYSGRSLQQIDVPAQKILAVAMYQMRALARVPTHAIVDDAVEQARDAGLGGAGGFVNAVLRKAAMNRAAGANVPDQGSASLEGVTPVTPASAPSVSTKRQRAAALQEDRFTPSERAEREFSFPREVFDRFARLYGPDDALAMCRAFNADPPMLARLIAPTTIEQLVAAGVDATPHAQPGIVVLKDVRRAKLRELADAGLCQPQDATSAATVDHLDLQPGQRVLDRCCGRGTKTRQIHERVGPTGRVVAMDPSEERLAQLRELLAKHSINNVQLVNAGTIDRLDPEEEFERVLIDAPCSNSGVFARRPEARYHQNPKHVSRIVELQRRILTDTAPIVASGGRIVYATCSVWPEENEAVVEAFLKASGKFKRLNQQSIPPQPSEDPTQYRDGGFVAVLEKR